MNLIWSSAKPDVPRQLAAPLVAQGPAAGQRMRIEALGNPAAQVGQHPVLRRVTAHRLHLGLPGLRVHGLDVRPGQRGAGRKRGQVVGHDAVREVLPEPQPGTGAHGRQHRRVPRPRVIDVVTRGRTGDHQVRTGLGDQSLEGSGDVGHQRGLRAEPVSLVPRPRPDQPVAARIAPVDAVQERAVHGDGAEDLHGQPVFLEPGLDRVTGQAPQAVAPGGDRGVPGTGQAGEYRVHHDPVAAGTQVGQPPP